jgi:hypothetical protein
MMSDAVMRRVRFKYIDLSSNFEAEKVTKKNRRSSPTPKQVEVEMILEIKRVAGHPT